MARASTLLLFALLAVVAACGDGPPSESESRSSSGAMAPDTDLPDADATAQPLDDPPRTPREDRSQRAPDQPAPSKSVAGRTLSEWISLLDDDDVSFWDVLEAVQAFGPTAIDRILDDFETLPESSVGFDRAERLVIGLVYHDESVCLTRMFALASSGSTAVRLRALEVLSRAAWDGRDHLALALEHLGPLLAHDDAAVRALALRSLERLHGEALPLAEQVRGLADDPDAEVRAAVFRTRLQDTSWWSGLVLRALSDPTAVVRRAACTELRTTPVRSEAVTAALLDALSDPDEGVREAAVAALSRCAGAAPEVVVALVEATSDGSDDVRRRAMSALQRLDRGSEIPLERVLAIVAQGGKAQRAAIELLAQQGTAAASAAPSILPLLDADDRHLRTETVKTLLTIAPDDPAVLDAVERRLGDSDEYVRQVALEELAKSGVRGTAAACRALGDEHAGVRRVASTILRDLGVEAVPTLTGLLDDPSPLRREAALDLLTKLAPAASADRAASLLSDPDADVRRAAAELLDRDASAAARHATKLAALLTDTSAQARLHAARALGHVHPLPAPAQDALRLTLEDDDPWVRGAAAMALLSSDADLALPVLSKLAPRGNLAWRDFARLARAAETSAASLDVLRAALRGPDECLRWKSAEALGGLGGTATSAVPALLDVLVSRPPLEERCRDGAHDARCAAIAALQAIAPDNDDVLNALHAAAEDADRWVRACAREALGLPAEPDAESDE